MIWILVELLCFMFTVSKREWEVKRGGGLHKSYFRYILPSDR